MSEGIIATVKGILLDPTSTFQSLREEALGEAVKYYAVLLLVPAVLSTLFYILFFVVMGIPLPMVYGTDVGSLTLLSGIGIGVLAGILIYIGGLISLFIKGVVFHILGVYIVGGREGIKETIKALAYASTPALLLCWIPLINLLAPIWSLILFILGVRELHKFSTSRAVLAIIIPVVIIIAAVSLVFSTAIIAFVLEMAGTLPSTPMV